MSLLVGEALLAGRLRVGRRHPVYAQGVIQETDRQKFILSEIITHYEGQWRLVVFINGGASKTIIEMSKSFIRRLPKFKGKVNKFLAKNAFDFAIAISIL